MILYATQQRQNAQQAQKPLKTAYKPFSKPCLYVGSLTCLKTIVARCRASGSSTIVVCGVMFCLYRCCATMLAFNLTKGDVMYILKSKDVASALQEVSDLVNKHIDQLEIKASDNIPKPMPIGKYPSLSNYKFHDGYTNVPLDHSSSQWCIMKSYGGSVIDFPSVESLESRKKLISGLIDQYESDCNKADADNSEAITNNKLIHEKVGLMMKHIGVKNSYSYTDKNSRARYPKSISAPAGYITDLQRDIPVSVGGYKKSVPELRSTLERVYRESLQKVIVKVREKEDSARKIKAAHELALLRAKYTPDNALADMWDIREAILGKDKYLRLAYWLEKNRDDWSDGYGSARNGLGGFEVTDSRDQEIHDNIQYLIDEWGGDGRCFRDCTWNYNAIYELVEDEQLLTDLGKLKEYETC